ncbi:MAG: hypothetical protein H6696_12250 [Deferribacteres bacterium]|nr:hypothetical protein [candidate division KSB1 bacterium]MCB9502699.1 hypothetical protein [Deferribacteres bacterium]
MRKIYYVFPKIQYPISLQWTATVVIQLIVFGVTVILTSRITENLERDMAIYMRFAVFIAEILLFSMFNFWLSIKLTHRIAGPLVQVQRVLNQARHGNYDVRVKMRTNDYLHEFATEVNLLLQGLEDSYGILKEIQSSFDVPKGADSNRIKQISTTGKSSVKP